jgi:pilus assembly protein Flp/PilA
MVKKFLKDEDGAALLEYTVLLGILLVTVVTVIGTVGQWINMKWVALATSLPGAAP